MTRRTRSFTLSALIILGLPTLLALFIVATSRLNTQVTTYADRASEFYQQTATTTP